MKNATTTESWFLIIAIDNLIMIEYWIWYENESNPKYARGKFFCNKGATISG